MRIVTKYYYFGGARVAMRGPDEAVVWLHGDHLGSTSLATDHNGAALPGSETRYYPFGQVRAGGDDLPTDFGYTGQREARGIGLYDFHARWYDPFVGRFVSADTIVPEPGNPQDFNRYSYVSNNPLLYIDPTGYFTEDAIKEYLQGVYGDQLVLGKYLLWELMLNSWKSNVTLWNMLSEATANDVLIYADGNDQVCFSRFLGEGQDELWGIENLPLPDIGAALGAKHDPNNDIGLPDVLKSDIVGLFSYDSDAHLRLKYSGVGLGTWDQLEARKVTGLEVAIIKGSIMVPTVFMPGGTVVKTMGGYLVKAVTGWAVSEFAISKMGLKSGNDKIFASNIWGHSLSVTLDRGKVKSWSVSRWEWPAWPPEYAPYSP